MENFEISSQHNRKLVPFNMEADSLNACVLGEDVDENSDEFNIFIKEI